MTGPAPTGRRRPLFAGLAKGSDAPTRPIAAVDASVAELLLSHAADFNADLVVMGGYGHPRANEFILGGVTRTMLTSMTVPVLMSH